MLFRSVTMGAGLVAGQFRLFRIRGLRDPSTGQYPLIDDVPPVRWGLVVSVANDPRYGTASVQIILFAAITPRIGPAAECSGVGDPETFETVSTVYVAPVPYASGAPAGTVSTDVETFNVGDAVVVRGEHLELKSTPTIITGISGTSITVFPLLHEALAPAVLYTPVAGDVLTFANYAAATDAQLADYAYFNHSEFGL